VELNVGPRVRGLIGALLLPHHRNSHVRLNEQMSLEKSPRAKQAAASQTAGATMKCNSSDINNVDDQHPLLKPTIDVVFKMTFGAPEMEASRNALLNAILRPASKIIHSEVINPKIPKRIVDDKGVVLDLLVKLANGTLVNIEMQLSDPASTWSRAPFYWARIYANQLLRGGKHRELKPTIVIFLVNYTQFKNWPDQSHHIYELRHRHERDLIHPHMRIDFVELPKIPLTLPGEMSFPPSERLSTWGQFLRGPADKALDEAYMNDPVLKATRDKLVKLSRDEKKRELARQAERAWLMRADAEELRRKTREETWGEALAEGQAQGEARVTQAILHSLLSEKATAVLSDEAIGKIVGVSIDSARRRSRISAYRKAQLPEGTLADQSKTVLTKSKGSLRCAVRTDQTISQLMV